jgi:hypothetical protein
MTEEEARKLLTGNFGKVLLEEACNYPIPIYWSTPKKDSCNVDNNGTAFLLDCGKGTFVVTAAHVYESYLKRKSEFTVIFPQLDDLEFKFEERKICCLGSNIIDIATFEIKSQEIEALKWTRQKKKWRGKQMKLLVLNGNENEWPPPEVTKGNGALFAGFPGKQRKEEKQDECSYGFYVSLNPISSVSDRHFACAFDRSKFIDAFGGGLPEEGYDLGGISGAPVLIIDESRARLISWHLGGVVYSASNKLGEIMFAHHAKFIKEDGMLDIPS